MSCFDVVYHQSTHHPGYLAYQRSSVPNSPLKKRCRLDPDLHQAGLPSPADGLYYDRGLSFPGSVDALKPDPLTSAAATSGVLSGHSTSRLSSGVSSFSSALTSPSTSSPSSTSPSTSSSSSCAASSTSSSTSSVVVALKCELMTSSSASNDDDEAQQPVMTQPIGGNGVLLTYFSEDIDTNIDNHFHRALQLAQQHGGAHRMVGRFNAASATSAIAESKSQGSSCCRQESSPLSQRSFPASFWNTVSCSSSSNSSSACPSSSCSSSSSSSYHPSNGSWSSLMVSPKADPLAAAFTVSPNHPSDPYHHLNTHFASAASPPGSLGPLHQDPWNPYAFCPPPPPPSQSGYRRYRHSIHEFSFTSDSPCSLGASAAAGGSHFGSSGMRYKSLLNGSASAGREDPKSHAAAAADVWRSRCYGCADVTSSHIAAGFTLSGDIEVTQTALPDASVKDVYWF